MHLLAIAHSANVKLTIDDFEHIRKKTPVLCDLKPSGRYVTVDLHKAGGVPQVMKILLERWALHGDCLTISGKTISEILKDVPPKPDSKQDVIRPYNDPIYPQGHLAILKGNLSSEGAVAKVTGIKKRSLSGPARVYESEEEALEAILNDQINARRYFSYSK